MNCNDGNSGLHDTVYLAHTDSETNREQLLSEHLNNTSLLCENFASVFSHGSDGRLCGLIHDIGKYSLRFLRRIHGESIRVDHSTAGALVAIKELKAPYIAMCVAGHHSGLLNCGSMQASYYGDGSFFGRLKARINTDIDDYSAYKNEIVLPDFSPCLPSDKREAFFYTHMLYSCLVDADFLDTEAFMSEKTIKRGGYLSISELSRLLDNYIQPWLLPSNELNAKRCEILKALIAGSEQKRGLFTLTVPTGGGKTVSSMAFALKHALKNKTADGNSLRRVIYVIPYISIIEQTQSVFEDIFGAENVVAHYSDMDLSRKDDETHDRKALATENWDAPIILTTAVRFFESLFSDRPSSCRKLHNIAGSVIIFDEAQMMPSSCITPCIWAVSQLIKNYYCSAVLCTATKPAFGEIFEKHLPEYPPVELCPAPEKMYEYFRRVTYVDLGLVTDELLAGKLTQSKQALCIVNTKKSAQSIYELLRGDGCFHLSTAMIPEDRRSTIQAIRQRLKNNEICRVVSTSLIEAGVDIDFPCVYREYAGIDSIVQAGGRCNREGKRKRDESFVYCFATERKTPAYISQNVSAAERTMRRFDDISAPEAVEDYFSFLLYTLRDDKAKDAKEIMRSIDTAFNLADIASDFKVVEDSGYSIVIPKNRGAELIYALERFGASRSLYRRLGKYTVNVYKSFFDELLSAGKAKLISENVAVLTDMDMYSDEKGLRLQVQDNNEVLLY